MTNGVIFSGGRICCKMVYNKKTRSKEDQMRKQNGIFDKYTKTIPSLKAGSSKVRFLSALEKWGFLDPQPSESGTRCLLTIHYFFRTWLSLSNSVEISSCPDRIGFALSARKQRRCKTLILGEGSNYIVCDENQLARICMSPPFAEALLRTSSSEVAHTTSNTDPNDSLQKNLGTVWVTSRLSRWMVHWNTIPSYFYLQDILRTARSCLQRVTQCPLCESLQEKFKQSKDKTWNYTKKAWSIDNPAWETDKKLVDSFFEVNPSDWTRALTGVQKHILVCFHKRHSPLSPSSPSFQRGHQGDYREPLTCQLQKHGLTDKHWEELMSSTTTALSSVLTDSFVFQRLIRGTSLLRGALTNFIH